MTYTFILILFLGIRHGLDLDHIAAIDAMTRNLNKKSWARYIGVLFSLGHGSIVVTISTLISIHLVFIQAPQHITKIMEIVSILFLFLLGSVNLLNAFKKNNPQPTLLKSFFMKKMMNKIQNPLSVFFVGCVFAVSFDTISQVSFFSYQAAMQNGGVFSILLGVIFVMGMMLSDGINAYLISRFIQKVNAPRFFSASIGIFSFLIAIKQCC